MTVPVPDPGEPRLAFTDDRDRLGMSEVRRRLSNGTHLYGADRLAASSLRPAFADVGSSVHTGELSSGESGTYAFVRTSGTNPGGDVLLVLDGAPAVAITCDSVVESHPVVLVQRSTLGWDVTVAFAADDGTGWDLWVSHTPAGTAPSCVSPRARVTDHPADDLWPAWLPDRRSLVFSSTRDDPLGDLYTVQVTPPRPGPGGAPPTETALRRVTDGAAAETQPAATSLYVTGTDETWVVFTTTQYRPDGSLAYVPLRPAPDMPTVAPLWAEPTDPATQSPSAPQSSEAQWSPGSTELLFTTTRDDPHGDVFLTAVRADGEGRTDRSRLIGMQPRDVTPVAAVPGLSESHGAWLERFATPTPTPAPPTDRDPVEYADIGFTFDAHVADVSDVVARDGSGRRTIGSTVVRGGTYTFDDAGPGYSPDGRRVAWAAKVPVGDRGAFEGRQIVVAAADGSGAVPLTTDRAVRDMDVDPVWSPDGARIAFVRYRSSGRLDHHPPEVWVATVATGVIERVSAPAPAGKVRHDVDPSWSPDGRRLVISRQDVQVVDASVALSTDVTRVAPGGTVALTVTVGAAPGPAPVRVDVSVDSHLTLPPTLPAGCERGSGGVVCQVQQAAQPGVDIVIPLTASRTGTFSVEATTRTDGTDPDPADDVAAVSGTVVRDPVVTLSLDAERVDPGTDVEATIELAEVDGPVDVTVVLPFEDFLTEALDPEVPYPPDGCELLPAGSTPDRFECTLRGVDGRASTPELVVNASGAGEHDVVATATPAGGRPVTSDPVSLDVLDASGDSEEDPPPVVDAGFHHLGGAPPARHRTSATPVLAALAAPAGHGAAVTAAVTTVRTSATTRAAPTAHPGTPQVWVVSAEDGSEEVDLGQTGRSPAWSPDGSRLVVERDGALHVITLADAGADGPDVPEAVTDATQVTGLAAGGATPSRPVLSVTEDPAWSPDGTEIALAGQPAGQPDQRGVYAVAPDGTGLREVAQQRGPETEPAYQPYADLVVTLTADPPAVEVGSTTTLTVAVTNAGPGTAADVRVGADLPAGLTAETEASGLCTVTAASVLCEVPGPLPRGAGVAHQVVVRGRVEGSRTATASAASGVIERDTADNRAATVVVVGPVRADVSVDVALGPGPEPVRAWRGGQPVTATLTVSNAGPAPATDVRLTVGFPDFVTVTAMTGCTAPPTACALGSVAPGGTTTVTATLGLPVPEPPPAPPAPQPPPPVDDGPVAEVTGPVTARVGTATTDPVAANDADEATMVLHTPSVRLLPRVAKPGTVVLAYGQNFPPGGSAQLSWSKGINASTGPVDVEDDGTFRYPVPVVRRDQLGDRSLVAAPAPGSPPAASFGPVRGPMLVVPRSTGMSSPAEILGRG
ncbi:DUF11 domain-containing protein [Cellulomonas aerilata]|uniref:DUF11 domain-containing protein n=1 Tax=Cellulomonas aerilata TaxID=515326 RepID=UPI0011BD4E72|nr:DUF11 domain-containing protein [Cellulomonas aerilata]